MKPLTPRALLLHDVNVQEGLGRPSLKGRSVLIRDGRIDAVLPACQAPLSGDQLEVRTLTGHTVMPGMTLAHAHVAYIDVTDARDTLFKYGVDELLRLAAGNLERLLGLGFTSVVGAGSVAGIDMKLKRALESGSLIGPHLVPCSRDLMVSGPPERRNPAVKARIPAELMPVLDDLEELAQATAREIEQGAEIVKVFSSGDDTYPNARSEQLLYSLEELQAVVRVAHARGVRVRAHSRGLAGIRNAIEAGVDIIDHASYADDAALEAIAERGLFLIPSLHQPRQLLLHGSRYGKTPAYLDSLGFPAEIANTLRYLPRAESLGIQVASGDDFGFAWAPHGSYAEELVTYVEFAGIPAETVLRWATANGAALAGRRDAGVIEPGRAADLVVTHGDPVEDIRLLTRAAAIRLVLLGGRPVVDRTDLAHVLT